MSWRDAAAEALDDLCAVDVSGDGINREPVSWWKTDFDFSRSYQLILECYLSGQVSEAQWQRHMAEEHFAAWVKRRQMEARR